jgi:NAD(P)-dependent dehydrogenase (short-subunit alcohol dehydrogenase family)
MLLKRSYAANSPGTVLMPRAIARVLLEQGEGVASSIISTSGARLALPKVSAYASSKK